MLHHKDTFYHLHHHWLKDGLHRFIFIVTHVAIIICTLHMYPLKERDWLCSEMRSDMQVIDR